MIQRKQSIYLLLAGLMSGISAGWLDLWNSAEGWVTVGNNTLALALFVVSAILSLLTVFLFKNRKLQMKLTGLNVLLNILLIGYLTYSLLNLPGGFSDSEKGIGLFAPFVSIVLLFMANRFIKKDEKLVKSVDRFR